jgi:hypothetical protein
MILLTMISGLIVLVLFISLPILGVKILDISSAARHPLKYYKCLRVCFMIMALLLCISITLLAYSLQ